MQEASQKRAGFQESYRVQPESLMDLRDARADGTRVVSFLLLLAFLNVQADGLRLSRSERTDQALLVPITVLFCVLLVLVLRRPIGVPARLRSLVESASLWQSLLKLALLALTASLAFLVLEARHYAAFGYRLHPWPTLVVFGCIAGSVIAPLQRRLQTSAHRLFASVLAGYAAISLLSMWSFPLAVQRSDMLPLLSAAGRVLLSGSDPYRLYSFPNETVFLTYLPGTLLAFIPAVALHLDLRLVNLVCVLGLATLLYRATLPAFRLQAASLMGVWLLSPYLLYRHEIYTAPHWLALTASVLLLARGKSVASAVTFGLSIALSQFSWILLPFFLLYLFHQRGMAACAKLAVVSVGSALAVLLPFALWSPQALVFGVLSHWKNQAVSARPVNVSYWFSACLGASHLQVAQASFLTILFVFCAATRRCTTLAGCLWSMAIALTCFTLLNILVWGYFFLLLEVLLLLYLFASNGWLTVSQQPSRQIDG